MNTQRIFLLMVTGLALLVSCLNPYEPPEPLIVNQDPYITDPSLWHAQDSIAFISADDGFVDPWYAQMSHGVICSGAAEMWQLLQVPAQTGLAMAIVYRSTADVTVEVFDQFIGLSATEGYWAETLMCLPHLERPRGTAIGVTAQYDGKACTHVDESLFVDINYLALLHDHRCAATEPVAEREWPKPWP